MLGIHFLFLGLAELATEIVLQLLKHLDDAARLVLVAVGLRCLVIHATQGVLHADECRDDGLRLLRHAAALRHLQQRSRCGGPVIVLLAHDGDGAVKGIDTLRIVLLLLEERNVVLLALLSLLRLVSLVTRELFLQGADLFAEGLDLAGELADRGTQALDLLAVLADLLLQLGGLHLAPSLELGEGDLISVLLLLDLGLHVFEHLDDLLNGRHPLVRSGHYEQALEEDCQEASHDRTRK
mmetsp:Transcript_48395/g.156031  ORF Transcript_48395/g.156031 Transcript_48395/m.156031 type:complete len:239 (-) Transcript_48395:274-990(-)